MKKRIFVAVKVPPDMEKSVELWQNKHSDFGIRWIKPKNLHITIIPPWYVDENQLLDVINKAKEAVFRIAPFEIGFNKVSFGPTLDNPRLIWAEGDTIKEFISLKENIEDYLFKSRNSGFYKKEQRQPKLHLTIARFKPHEIDITKIPPLQETTEWKISVDSVEIMESVLKKSGAEYIILENIQF